MASRAYERKPYDMGTKTLQGDRTLHPQDSLAESLSENGAGLSASKLSCVPYPIPKKKQDYATTSAIRVAWRSSFCWLLPP